VLTRANSTVLVVDDDAPIRDYLAQVLRFEGYECHTFNDSLAALAYLRQDDSPADLVLADISMPDMGGIELLREVKSSYPDLPVILISGLYELALALDALEAGADDYLKKPVRPGDIVALVSKYLTPDPRQHQEVQEALRHFLDSRPPDPKTSEQIKAVFQKLGFKRYETYEHSARVASLCYLFGRHCALSQDALHHLELGALLHDIGKIGIPRNVLLKPGPLTDEEWRVMRLHPAVGYSILLAFPELLPEAEVVYCHHERYDGLGYPRGLAAEEIPLGARIFSIVDTFDAITSERPYRAAQSIDVACDEIRKASGSQFDPALVEIFLKLPRQDLQEIRRRFPSTSDEML
jgi:response regulator RpfG family c-di-GMP phosphodiesterase